MRLQQESGKEIEYERKKRENEKEKREKTRMSEKEKQNEKESENSSEARKEKGNNMPFYLADLTSSLERKVWRFFKCLYYQP